jgi:4,5-dihydroxyphthalate decarboxylase
MAMGNLAVTMMIKDYDHIAPLACGDVVPEGIELKLIRDTPGALDRTLNDPSIDFGELSFSRHLTRLANGDDSFVGIPVFTTRAYRHRCFFVRRDSVLRGLKDLEGKRIGTNEWPATGNTWSRAALREQGVRIDRISWLVGSIDGAPSNRPQGSLPPYVQLSGSQDSMRELLVEGELDALMCPNPPRGFYDAGSPIVRLIPDYHSAEREYFQRTSLYPAHHIMGIRRELFQREPWVARSLYQAMDRSKAVCQQNVTALPETTPWLLEAIEEATEVMGKDWRPYGVGPNGRMIQTLCHELFAQELLPKKLDGSTVFAEFEKVMGA